MLCSLGGTSAALFGSGSETRRLPLRAPARARSLRPRSAGRGRAERGSEQAEGASAAGSEREGGPLPTFWQGEGRVCRTAADREEEAFRESPATQRRWERAEAGKTGPLSQLQRPTHRCERRGNGCANALSFPCPAPRLLLFDNLFSSSQNF